MALCLYKKYNSILSPHISGSFKVKRFCFRQPSPCWAHNWSFFLCTHTSPGPMFLPHMRASFMLVQSSCSAIILTYLFKGPISKTVKFRWTESQGFIIRNVCGDRYNPNHIAYQLSSSNCVSYHPDCKDIHLQLTKFYSQRTNTNSLQGWSKYLKAVTSQLLPLASWNIAIIHFSYLRMIIIKYNSGIIVLNILFFQISVRK